MAAVAFPGKRTDRQSKAYKDQEEAFFILGGKNHLARDSLEG